MLRSAPSLVVLGILYGLAFAMPPGWAEAWGFDWTPQAWWMHLGIGACALGLLHAARSGLHRLVLAWLFCWAWFASGLAWLTVSMSVYGGMPQWMAVAALLAFSAYLALYPAVAIGVASQLPSAAARIAFSGAAVLLLEWLRGLVFTGFPWLSPGYAQIDGPLGGMASSSGVYALGAAAWACSAALHWLWVSRGRALQAWITLIIFPCAAWALSSVAWTTPSGEALRVALVQGQIAQDMKFDPVRVGQTMAAYTARIEALAGSHDLIVLPETAWTDLWPNTPQALRDRWSQVAAPVALGAPDVVDGAITNSVLLIQQARVVGRYDKHHLVPFGEFVPWGFRWFVNAMRIPLGDFHRGHPLQAGLGLRTQVIAFNICYEDLFGEELAAQLRSHPSTSILINVSNLAWFGHSHALPQHLQIARMRALELGRPMLRATNTGVTAAIAPDGTVLAALGLRQADALSVAVLGTKGLTPFARFGNTPAVMLAIGVVALLVLLRSKARIRGS